METETTIFVRRVVDDAEGNADEETWLSDDEDLTRHLEELTTTGFHDDRVEVIVEDFSEPTEDGGTRSGTAVRLRPRVQESDDAIRAVVERATSQPYEDYLAERARRPRPSPPTAEETLEVELASLDVPEDELVLFRVQLSPEPSNTVRRRPGTLVALSELERLDRRLEFAESIVARGDEVVSLQEPFVEWLMRNDGEVMRQFWIHNALLARMTADVARSALERDDVIAVSADIYDVPHAVWKRDVVRDKLQVAEYLTAGYDGEHASSRSDYGIFFSIMEASDGIEVDHDGLNDDAVGNSRVVETHDCDCSPFCGCDGVLDACVGTHGMDVMTIAVADFMDFQRDGLDDWTLQSQLSGIAQEAFIQIVSVENDDIANAVEVLIEDGVDLVNYSAGEQDPDCETHTWRTEVVEDAYQDGILWINSQGNDGNCSGAASCIATQYAAASGSVSVGMHGATTIEDLDDWYLCLNSSDGRASWGPVADLIAPGGLYKPMDCSNDFDSDMIACDGTSFAAPHVAGAAALLQHYWIARFSDLTAHQPGRMHAVLLNMGDGCGQQSLIDGRRGAGRLRMRMFDAPGMDSPWRHLTVSTTLSAADESSSWALNVDSNGVNQPIPAAVDSLSATVFCYWEDPGDPDKPDIWLELRDVDLNEFYTAPNHLGEKARYQTNPTNHRYELHLTVAPIEAGTVSCWVNMAYEDGARDDADGPASDIETWPPYDFSTTCNNGCT